MAETPDHPANAVPAVSPAPHQAVDGNAHPPVEAGPSIPPDPTAIAAHGEFEGEVALATPDNSLFLAHADPEEAFAPYEAHPDVGHPADASSPGHDADTATA